METSAPVVKQKVSFEQHNDSHLFGIVAFMVSMAVVTVFLLPYSPNLAEASFQAAGAALILALVVIGN